MQSRILRTEGDVRREVERRLRAPVRADVWGYVSDQGWVSDAYDAEALEYLVTQIRSLSERFPRTRQVGEQTTRARRGSVLHALTRDAAAEASADERVESFRKEELGGSLLSAAEVAPWIEAFPRPATPKEMLEYLNPAGHRLKRPVGDDDALGRLCRLSDSLSRRYGWDRAPAVAFILTGGSMTAVAATARVRRTQHPAGDRIVLEIHPTLPAKRVAQFYADVKRSAPGAATRPDGRRRGPAEESAERRSWPALAAFVAEVNDGRTWADARKAWNASHKRSRPAWCYDSTEHVGTFIGHARKAYSRVRGAELEWKSPKARGRE